MDGHSKKIALRLRVAPVHLKAILTNIFDNEGEATLWREVLSLRHSIEPLPDPRKPDWGVAERTRSTEPERFAAIAPYRVGDCRGRIEVCLDAPAPDVVPDNRRPRTPYWSLGYMDFPNAIASPGIWVTLTFSDTFFWEFYLAEAIVLATCAHIYELASSPYLEMIEGNWHRLPSLSREAVGAFLLRFGALFDAGVPVGMAGKAHIKRSVLSELSLCGICQPSFEAAAMSIALHKLAADERDRQPMTQGVPGSGLVQARRPTPKAGTPLAAAPTRSHTNTLPKIDPAASSRSDRTKGGEK